MKGDGSMSAVAFDVLGIRLSFHFQGICYEWAPEKTLVLVDMSDPSAERHHPCLRFTTSETYGILVVEHLEQDSHTVEIDGSQLPPGETTTVSEQTETIHLS